jgi:hypothetical protein
VATTTWTTLVNEKKPKENIPSLRENFPNVVTLFLTHLLIPQQNDPIKVTFR